VNHPTEVDLRLWPRTSVNTVTASQFLIQASTDVNGEAGDPVDLENVTVNSASIEIYSNGVKIETVAPLEFNSGADLETVSLLASSTQNPTADITDGSPLSTTIEALSSLKIHNIQPFEIPELHRPQKAGDTVVIRYKVSLTYSWENTQYTKLLEKAYGFVWLSTNEHGLEFGVDTLIGGIMHKTVRVDGWAEGGQLNKSADLTDWTPVTEVPDVGFDFASGKFVGVYKIPSDESDMKNFFKFVPPPLSAPLATPE
jgi:hypothetical protein